MRQDHPIEALPADLYQAVLKSYATLGIPTGKTLGEAGIIGSEKFDRTHNFAGAPLSLSYECGDGATGPNADSYRLTIAVVAWVRPDPKNGKSILSLASLASAESVEGARRAPRACTSTGRIEGKIVDEVRKILGIE
jgi:hypothetical protein